jgi:membrane protein
MALKSTAQDAPARPAQGNLFSLLKETVEEFQKDNVGRLAAALTYYTLFAMPPVLIIVLAVASTVLGQQAAQGQLFSQVQGYIGPGAAQVIQSMVENSARPDATLIATIISIVAIVVAASGLFAELQVSLNQIWDIPTPPSKGFLGGILSMLKGRLLAFALVLGCGVLLLVTFIISVAITALGNLIQSVWAAGTEPLLQAISFVVTFLLMALVFAIIYRVLPDTDIAWGDVWIGALFTSFLFNLGRLLIALYLGTTSYSSTYGAAGSLIALLVWVNYSAQIFYLGAEFTQVYARRNGSHLGAPAAA